jgi:hypothetical protein
MRSPQHYIQAPDPLTGPAARFGPAFQVSANRVIGDRLSL